MVQAKGTLCLLCPTVATFMKRIPCTHASLHDCSKPDHTACSMQAGQVSVHITSEPVDDVTQWAPIPGANKPFYTLVEDDLECWVRVEACPMANDATGVVNM